MVDYFNSKHYPDPTAYTALMAIEKEERKSFFKPLVYICSPYSGDIDGNVKAARRYSRFAAMEGYLPITPHLLYPQFLDDNNSGERDLALLFCKILISKCKDLWIFGDSMTDGMEQEKRYADKKCIPIRHFSTDCKEVK